MQKDYIPFGIIYKITAPSGRAYVGKTTQPLSRRRAAHESDSAKKPICPAIHRAIKKHGDAMVWEILSRHSNAAELNAAEIAAIAKHRTLSPNGYNLTAGGEGGKRSDETKQRHRENMKTPLARPELSGGNCRQIERARILGGGIGRTCRRCKLGSR